MLLHRSKRTFDAIETVCLHVVFGFIVSSWVLCGSSVRFSFFFFFSSRVIYTFNIANVDESYSLCAFAVYSRSSCIIYHTCDLILRLMYIMVRFKLRVTSLAFAIESTEWQMQQRIAPTATTNVVG